MTGNQLTPGEREELDARGRKFEEQLRRNEATYSLAAEPLLEELSAAGFQVASVGELLRRYGKNYRCAVPILLEWLPRVEYLPLKEDIVRTLSVPWARPAAAPVLVAEFKRAKDDLLRWAIGNALEVVAGKAELEELVKLVRDKSYGTARQMLAIALGKMKDRRALETLLELLEDDDVVGHAIIGLGKLQATEARPRLEALRQHPKTWIRKEVVRALAKIESVGR